MIPDRRPSKLHDPKAAMLWWNAEGKNLSIVELYEAVHDPVAVVRRGVESGTIKGEVGWWCLTHRNGVVQTGTFPPDSCWSFNADADSCLLVDATVVIGPVSDGGSET